MDNAKVFPRLAMIVKQIMCAPASTAAVERLFSIAGYILSSHRTRLTDESFESFLFANVNFELYDVAIGKKLKI